MPSPILLVGLGNPGKKYASNRHNVGFMAIDTIREAYGFGTESQKYSGQLSDGILAEHKILAFKPMSYMNCSGQPVGELARYYKIPPEKIIVLHDELDVPMGKIKVKRGGGAGGHNGLKSLDQHIGKEYLRVRIGIGHPGDKDLVTPYVLSDFASAELPTLTHLLAAIAQQCPDLIGEDDEGKIFQNKVALAIASV